MKRKWSLQQLIGKDKYLRDKYYLRTINRIAPKEGTFARMIYDSFNESREWEIGSIFMQENTAKYKMLKIISKNGMKLKRLGKGYWK
jgi:hypothetical protein